MTHRSIALALVLALPTIAHARGGGSATTAAPAAGPATEPAPAAAAAPAPAAASAAAPVVQVVMPQNAAPSRDVGWDTRFGLLFGIPNLLKSKDLLEGYGDFGIGAQYNLSPTAALRLGLTLARSSNPVTTQTTKTETDGTEADPVETFTRPVDDGTFDTSTFAFGVGVDYLMRMTTNELSPYYGGGLSFAWENYALTWRDDVTVEDEVTSYDRSRSAMRIGLRGVLGVDWRIYKSLSVYAEYGLGLALFNRESTTATTEVINDAADTDVKTTTESSGNRLINFDVGLVHRATLGLMAHF